MQHTINNTQVNTQVVGNTNTTTCQNNINNITDQVLYCMQHYIPRMSLNVVREPTVEVEKIDASINFSSKSLEGVRSRSWFLTINNFTADDIEQIRAENTSYKVWQYEIGSKSGVKHLHCLLYYKNARVWPKKRFPTARIEIPRDLSDCIKYCQKERTRLEGPWEEGECPAQGRRKDLEVLASEIKEGKRLDNIASENPSAYIRYHKGLQAFQSSQMKHRNPKLKATHIWIYGPSGVGKTRIVWDMFDFDDIYPKDNSQWWDGYTQQKVVLWDEIAGVVKAEDFLRIFDRYPLSVQIKGGYVPLNSMIMIVTSSHSPLDMFGGTDNRNKEIMRRIDIVVKLEEDGSMIWEKSDWEHFDMLLD